MTNKDQIVIYQTKDGNTQLDIQLKEETVWLTQKQMAFLFDKNNMTINEHVKNIYQEGELEEKPTIRKSLIVQTEGKRKVKREINLYNLDVIISVGYRVKSKQGTQFRIWANKILKEYLVKGYAINEKRLKEKVEQFEELKKIVHLQEKVISEYQLDTDEAKVEEDIKLELGNILIFQNYSSCSF